MDLLEKHFRRFVLTGCEGIRRQRERQTQHLNEKVDRVVPHGGLARLQNPMNESSRLRPIDDGRARIGAVRSVGVGEKKEKNFGMNAENGEIKRAIEGESEGIQRRQHAENHRGDVGCEGKHGQRVVETARAAREEA